MCTGDLNNEIVFNLQTDLDPIIVTSSTGKDTKKTMMPLCETIAEFAQSNRMNVQVQFHVLKQRRVNAPTAEDNAQCVMTDVALGRCFASALTHPR